MQPAGGGSNIVTSRFIRHMNIVSIDVFDESTLSKIFNSIMEWHFNKGFDEKVSRLGKVHFVSADFLQIVKQQGEIVLACSSGSKI